MKHWDQKRLFRIAAFVLLLPSFEQTVCGGDPQAFSVAALLFDDEALARPHDVEIQGNLAFIPGKGGSIAIVDVADPTKPKILWHHHEPRGLDDAETVLPLGSRLLLGANDFIVFDITAIVGGYALVWLVTYINLGDNLFQIAKTISAADIIVGIIKAVLFGISITVICLYHGFKTKRHTTQIPVAASKASLQCFGSCLVISATISALFYL